MKRRLLLLNVLLLIGIVSAGVVLRQKYDESKAHQVQVLKQKPAPVARILVGYNSGRYTGNPLKIPLVKKPRTGSISIAVEYADTVRNVPGSVAAAPIIMIANADLRPIRSAMGANVRYPSSAPAFSDITA